MKKEEIEECRAFKEALRARVRLIAAERNLPDAEIKWVGRLKLKDLASFGRQHNVSAEWLLTGCLKARLRMARGMRGGPSPL